VSDTYVKICDGGQCRIWLNEAQREIDRLRNGLAVPPSDASAPAQPDRHFHDTFERSESAPGPSTALIYSPPAIGDASQISWRESPPPPMPPQPFHNHFHVTNLATLIDVLM